MKFAKLVNTVVLALSLLIGMANDGVLGSHGQLDPLRLPPTGGGCAIRLPPTGGGGGSGGC